jgi:phospholipid/cholesterol/gamma-HCH transport system permease protein
MIGDGASTTTTRRGTGAPAAARRVVEEIGAGALYTVYRMGLFGVLFVESLFKFMLPPYALRPVLKQVHFIGARSMLVIVVSGIFLGMVVALQFHDTLVRFGSVSLLGSAVGLSLVRELGPVITALMVIGRAGSAICAEMAIMRAEEQIDALEGMSIDPHRFLIAPRLLAGLISVPLLTAVFIVVGVLGGWFVGVVLLGVGQGAYFEGMYESVLPRDLLMGLVKSVVFGALIVWIATAKGFFLHLERGGAFGPEGISRTTTSAVVISAIAVLFADYIVSALFL